MDGRKTAGERQMHADRPRKVANSHSLTNVRSPVASRLLL